MDVDAIFVATSHDALYECSLAAIQAGKHVMAEKPIGVDEKEAAHLEEAVAQSNVCFMSGYSFRYIAAWQKVRELLQAGAVVRFRPSLARSASGPCRRVGGQASIRAAGRCCMSARIWWSNALVHGRRTCRGGRRHPLPPADMRADETTTFQIQFSRGAVAQGMVTQTAHAGLFSNLDIYGREGRIGLHGVGFTYFVDVVSSTRCPPTASRRASNCLRWKTSASWCTSAVGRVCAGDPRAAAARHHGERRAARAQGARRVHQVGAYGAIRCGSVLRLRRRMMKMDERRSVAQRLGSPKSALPPTTHVNCSRIPHRLSQREGQTLASDLVSTRRRSAWRWHRGFDHVNA